MTEAAIVSTARTPIGKAFRGAFNLTHGATHGGPRHPARGRKVASWRPRKSRT